MGVDWRSCVYCLCFFISGYDAGKISLVDIPCDKRAAAFFGTSVFTQLDFPHETAKYPKSNLKQNKLSVVSSS